MARTGSATTGLPSPESFLERVQSFGATAYR